MIIGIANDFKIMHRISYLGLQLFYGISFAVPFNIFFGISMSLQLVDLLIKKPVDIRNKFGSGSDIVQVHTS